METSNGPSSPQAVEGGATEAVLELLRDTQVGCWTPAGRLLRGGVDRVEEGEEGEEGGPGQP